MKKLSIFISFLLLTFCQLGYAQTEPTTGKVFSVEELRNALQSSDRAKWSEIVDSEVPASANFNEIDFRYGAKIQASLRLGLAGKAEEISRKWIAAGTGHLTPKFTLFEMLWRGTATQLEDAISVGEDLINSARFPNEKVRTRLRLANLYLTLGEFSKADALLVEAQAIVPSFRNDRRPAAAFFNPLANAELYKSKCLQQQVLFQPNKATDLCLQSVEAALEANKNKALLPPQQVRFADMIRIQAWTTLTDIYSISGRFYDADLSIKKAMEVSIDESSESKIGINFSQLNLAAAKKDTVGLEELIQRIRRSIPTLQIGKSSAGMVFFYNQLQAIYVSQEQWGQAAAQFEESDKQLVDADLLMRKKALNLIPRSLTYLMTGKAAMAVPNLDAELKQISANLGADHPQAGLLRGLLALAQIAGDLSKEGALLPELDRAVTAMISSGAQSGGYFNQIDHPIAKRMIFEKYVELAGRSANPLYSGRALGIADSLRSSSVQSAMNDAAVRASAATPALADLVRRDQDAKNELASLYNFISNRSGEIEAKRLEGVIAQMKVRIDDLEKSRASLGAEITKQFPEYSKLTHPAPPTITDISAKLKPDEALITLLPTDSTVYVWAISRDEGNQAKQSFAKVDLNKAQLAALVKRLRASLDVAGLVPTRRPAFDHAASQELYAKLIAPVQQSLAGKGSLIIAAGGALGQIPFGVLQTADKDSWLIKQAAITHVPSVAAWLSMRALPHQTASLPMLAWGDPLFDIALASSPTAAKGEVRKVDITRLSTSVDLDKEDPRSAIKYANIPTLPETRDELTAIAKTLGADAAKDLILGSAATRESVLKENKNGELAKRRVVAFATHGLMAGDLPNLTQPALAMAGTKDDAANVLAPLLTLEDVLTLKLNADWVVLSACNTAAADGKAEEALSGLARGFFYAGSRSLLVTHWSVESESAMQLTTETFKNYHSNPTQAKAESLRQAMLTVMKNPATAHPTYWAPYALVGDGAR